MQRSCGTCRRRRQACDKSKPTWRRCVKDGMDCEGYADPAQKLFVNFHAGNITTRRKRVLCDAIHAQQHDDHRAKTPPPLNGGGSGGSSDSGDSSGSSQRGSSSPCSSAVPSVGTPISSPSSSPPPRHQADQSLANLRYHAIYTLELTSADFAHHVATIWNTFELGHTVTSEGWAPALTALLHQSRSLDLAIIALSALRMAQAANDRVMRVMGLAAYQYSLRIHRRMCEGLPGIVDARKRSALLGMLASVSLIHALFEGTQHSLRDVFEEDLVGKNPHLRGASVFLRESGPRAFVKGGEHLTFKKLRQMTLLMSLSNREPSFLAEKEWSLVPWSESPKTRWDQLYDIAAQLTQLAATLLSKTNCHRTLSAAETARLQQRCCLLDSAFKSWRECWTTTLTTPEQLSLASDLDRGIIAVHLTTPDLDAETANVLFLVQEYIAMRLMLKLMSSELSRRSPQTFQISAGQTLADCLEASALAARLKMLLALPIFKQDVEDDAGGLVEGQCRSLLSGWTMVQFKRISAHWGR